MWKISNEANRIILDKFNNLVIDQLMKKIVLYKKNQKKYSSFKDFINNVNMDKNSLKILNYVLKIKKDKKYISDYVDNLIKIYSSEELETNYRVYVAQNNMISNHNVNIDRFDLDENYKLIFVDFFYERFFNDSKLWSLIDYSYKSYSRNQFHKNFLDENKMSVCPYCDIDTINALGNSIIEHFLPKTQYPFLAMNSQNMITSCHSCNGSFGKLSNFIIPITVPYVEQISDSIKFSMNLEKSSMILHTDVTEVANYIKMLRLTERYSQKRIFDHVFQKSEWILGLLNYDDAHELDYSTLKKYIMFKKEPLSLAVLDSYYFINKYLAENRYD